MEQQPTYESAWVEKCAALADNAQAGNYIYFLNDHHIINGVIKKGGDREEGFRRALADLGRWETRLDRHRVSGPPMEL